MTTQTVPQHADQTKKTGLLQNRTSRIVVGVLAVIVIIIAAVGIMYTRGRSERSVPLAFKVYPGAIIGGAPVESQGDNTRSDRTFYLSTAPYEEIRKFYVNEYGDNMRDLPNGATSGCATVAEGSDPAVTVTRCIMDNSQEQDTQRLLIEIRVDPALKATVIDVIRDWRK